jgi:hypothetical protein
MRIIQNGQERIGVEMPIIDEKGGLHMIVTPNSDKNAAKTYFDNLIASQSKGLNLNLDPTRKSGIRMFSEQWERYSNIALLRIAYLWGFSIFGYSFIFTEAMQMIRKQIMNPKEQLLPSFGILTSDFPNEILGISRITEPDKLKSFLVVFDLSNEQTKHSRRYGVLLPQPNDMSLSVYDVYKSLGQEETQVSFTTVGDVNKNQDYLLGSIGW